MMQARRRALAIILLLAFFAGFFIEAFVRGFTK